MKKTIHTFLESYTCKSNEKKLLLKLKKMRESIQFDVSRIKFSDMEKWSKQKDTGDLVHESGKFFSIKCGRAQDIDTGKTRFQPIIDQPEQGILGIISRYAKGRLEILLQMKVEPGNVDVVQLSPTVQATKSNYTRVHKGSSIPYLWEFKENHDGLTNIVSKAFQSEHGYKFYKKANDNMHVHNNDTEIIDDRFEWFTLSDIRTLLSNPCCINMDTRSVLATMDFIGETLKASDIDFDKFGTMTSLEKDLIISSVSDESALWKMSEIKTWITNHKKNKRITQKLLPLKKLPKDWKKTSASISNSKIKDFEVIAIKSSIDSREVSSWCQPIVKDNAPKVYAFILKKINNIFHVYIQAIEEDFSWDGPELGPSITQYDNDKDGWIPELEKEMTVIYDSYQPEEGGRFMQQKNRYMMFINDDNSGFELETFQQGTGVWMTLHQLKRMCKFPCVVNIEARTLLTIASYYSEGAFLRKKK